MQDADQRQHGHEYAGNGEGSYGITAAALLEFGGNRGRLGAHDLERWLVEHGFAEPNGAPDRLVPTEFGLEVGAALGAPLAAAITPCQTTLAVAQVLPHLAQTAGK